MEGKTQELNSTTELQRRLDKSCKMAGKTGREYDRESQDSIRTNKQLCYLQYQFASNTLFFKYPANAPLVLALSTYLLIFSNQKTCTLGESLSSICVKLKLLIEQSFLHWVDLRRVLYSIMHPCLQIHQKKSTLGRRKWQQI